MTFTRFAVICLLTTATSEASAQLVFDLVQDDSSVLATLTLAKVPSEPEDVVSLNLSQQAQSLFGYGPSYEGTFDVTSLEQDFGRFEFEDDGIGLTGRAAITVFSLTFADIQPPPTSLSDIEPFQFDILAQDVKGGTDALVMRYFESGALTSIRGTGTWKLVPEPSTATLLIACLPHVYRQRTPNRIAKRFRE